MASGKSLSLSQNNFLQPSGSRSVGIEEETPSTPTHRYKRNANVYDAVAGLSLHFSRLQLLLTMKGRINAHGFMSSAPYASKYRDTASSSAQPARPDELLFRRKRAPTRYEETDFYYAHESLPPGISLPSSDLLVGIHAYAADFYRRATKNRGQSDMLSMDETALIALGILLEEMAKESLGEAGDLVLVEGERISDDRKDPLAGSGGRDTPNTDQVVIQDDNSGDEMDDAVRQGRSKRAHSVLSDMIASGDDLNSVMRKRSKRRKLSHPSPTVEIDMENDGEP
jgi:hypothetical protein